MKQETQFSFFPRLTTNQPSGLITLEELHRLVTTDAALKENTEKYRYFKAQGFDDDAAKIKRSRCPAFTPSHVSPPLEKINRRFLNRKTAVY